MSGGDDDWDDAWLEPPDPDYKGKMLDDEIEAVQEAAKFYGADFDEATAQLVALRLTMTQWDNGIRTIVRNCQKSGITINFVNVKEQLDEFR